MAMPMRFLKRLSPRRSQITRQWFMRPFGAVLHDPALWRLDRHGAARAVALGLFIAWLPIPMQMAAAAMVALWIRVHLPLAVATVWVSNPFTVVPMFYGAYRVGLWLLGADPVGFNVGELHRAWQPLLFGSVLLGAVSAFIGYFVVDLLWYWTLVGKYRRIKAAAQRRAARTGSVGDQ